LANADNGKPALAAARMAAASASEGSEARRGISKNLQRVI
jgi:hypothetical protein